MEAKKFLETHWKSLFRGFWEGGKDGNPKARKGKSSPKPLEQSESFPSLLGALLPDVVLVDYDDPAAFQCRVKIAKAKKENCVAIESPHRGGHIYFYDRAHRVQRSNDHNQTLLGFYPVDYKCGYRIVKSSGEIKQADVYGCLSNDDKSLRRVVYFNFREDGSLDEIPVYDLHVGSNSKEKPFPFDFLDMKTGEGRQDALFNWMIPVKRAGFTYEEYHASAAVIEEFLFADPLGPEFENAVRVEAWDSINAAETLFFKDNRFLHNVFADHLIKLHHIIRINGQVHSYCEGVYVPGWEKIEAFIVQEIPSLNRAKINEVLNYVRITAAETSAADDLNYLAFKNGILNLDTDQLEPFTPDHIITNRIPWNYNSNTKHNLTDVVLDRLSCGDKEIRFALEEIAGACLFRSALLGGGKGVILVGDRANGKSTFLYMIEAMLGRENYSALDIKELNERFSTILIYGKLANIGDDISSEYILDTSYLKKLITGETIKAENKGEKPIKFVSYATQIFSANDVPRMKDRSQAAARRLLFIPFNAKFDQGSPEYDPFIRRKLNQRDCMERFVYLAVCGLHDVLESGSFTVPKKAAEKHAEYEVENNPVLSFIEDVGEGEIINEDTAEVYRRYHVFCIENGFQAQSKISFVKDINHHLGTESVQKWRDGKNIKIFCKS